MNRSFQSIQFIRRINFTGGTYSIIRQNNFLKIGVIMNQQSFLDHGVPLANYRSFSLKPLFKDAGSDIPQFLKENLIDDQRVIKYFRNDVQAYLRVFYFQYLKLCFEMEQADYQMYITKIELLLTNPEFSFAFPPGKEPKLYNNSQFKRFLIEFMEVLDEQDMAVDIALMQYPIMDQVLVSLFRGILIYHKQCKKYNDQINRENLFEFLASQFCVDVALYENCLKFIDSDVFLYQENESQLYMIYIDYKERQLNNINQLEQYPMQPSDGNISSVRQMVSNMNLSEINQDLEMSNEENQSGRKQNGKQIQSKQQEQKDKLIKIQQNGGYFSQSQDEDPNNYEFMDFTYSKNSDQKIGFINKDKESFKLSMNSGSYGDFLNLSLKENVHTMSNKAILINQGSSHSIKNKPINDNYILTPIIQTQDFASTLRIANQDKKRASHMIKTQKQYNLGKNHQHSSSQNQKRDKNILSKVDPQTYRNRLSSVLDSKPINLNDLDKFINKVNKQLAQPNKIISNLNDNQTVLSNNLSQKQNIFFKTVQSNFNQQLPLGDTLIRIKQSELLSSLDSNFKKQCSFGGLSTVNPSSLLLNTGFKNNNAKNENSKFSRYQDQYCSQIIQNSCADDSKAKDYLRINLTSQANSGFPRNSPWKNITKQFTNSYILKQMPEPYKQSIDSIKMRSRAQRNNIGNLNLNIR